MSAVTACRLWMQFIIVFAVRWRPLVAAGIITAAKEDVRWSSMKAVWGGRGDVQAEYEARRLELKLFLYMEIIFFHFLLPEPNRTGSTRRDDRPIQWFSVWARLQALIGLC